MGREWSMISIHRRGAEDAEGTCFVLSVDPGGIGSAFHRAGRAERKKLITW